MPDTGTHVIVGAGLAGAKAAEACATRASTGPSCSWATSPSRTEPLDRQAGPRSVTAGVDLATITSELEREGVEAFNTDYRKLLAAIGERVVALRGGSALVSA
jgi:flavin-dependent dehydrogenase